MEGTWSFRRAAHRESMGVVAISRKEAIREKTPFIISVTMEMTPPVIVTIPSCSIGVRSRNGFTRPTAQTRGSTMRSL